jgi:hypothetical protein
LDEADNSSSIPMGIETRAAHRSVREVDMVAHQTGRTHQQRDAGKPFSARRASAIATAA